MPGTPDGDRPFARFAIPDPFPEIVLPEGFHLKSLADDCDWAKVNRVLWRGFNHPGEPPVGETALAERRVMFDTPKARRDLKGCRSSAGGRICFLLWNVLRTGAPLRLCRTRGD